MSLQENVANIMDTLARESAAWGRTPRLIAVTKTVDASRILPLCDLGVRDIAENRVQSLMEKIPSLERKFQFHMIGRLQTNKVKYIIDSVCLIHSMDRLPLAQEIDRRAQMAGRLMPVLLQVNIAREPQKTGVDETEVFPMLRALAKFSGLSVQGLMTILPLGAPREDLLSLFLRMRALFDRAAQESIDGIQMRELSMGMSQDYDLAARAGATMVRVGSALFQ